MAWCCRASHTRLAVRCDFQFHVYTVIEAARGADLEAFSVLARQRLTTATAGLRKASDSELLNIHVCE